MQSGRQLRALGFWTSSYAKGLPHPKIFQDETWDTQERNMVIIYLKRHLPIVSFLGLSYCRFECGELRMGASDITDGVYCWPEGLVHYLEKHAVRLPVEFVEHVRKNVMTPTLNKNAELEILWHFAPDFSWWKFQKGIKQ